MNLLLFSFYVSIETAISVEIDFQIPKQVFDEIEEKFTLNFFLTPIS